MTELSKELPPPTIFRSIAMLRPQLGSDKPYTALYSSIMPRSVYICKLAHCSLSHLCGFRTSASRSFSWRVERSLCDSTSQLIHNAKGSVSAPYLVMTSFVLAVCSCTNTRKDYQECSIEDTGSPAQQDRLDRMYHRPMYQHHCTILNPKMAWRVIL